MVQILSIGELIHTYRHKQGMALSQLTTLTGIHKATISKIENGEVRRPEYATIQPLARALNVPLKEFIELYVTVERRAEPLLRVLKDVLQQGENAALVRTVGAAFLASTSDDSYTLVEQLHDFSTTVELKTMRLTLYQLNRRLFSRPWHYAILSERVISGLPD
ncbi:helix-turn-helix domain-containing protein [Paenibacillus sp. MER 180]|uniref:helix-turn-helix domain-containing protein n=1 Tax=Paenibacillus sp. MER 180 TaxID=2939570 RepID=UPI002040DFE2|nr:helix-turn-helix domain-containing protein [Paenibacillus sp. MER 180]MCM3288724.1 helix-turn-helix domain-containing protein [Paenibacillus sp. MER 180]